MRRSDYSANQSTAVFGSKTVDVTVDPINMEWIGIDNHSILKAIKGRDGKNVIHETKVFKCLDSIEQTTFTSKERHQTDITFARFVPSDSCSLDLGGLTARVIKTESIMTNIYLGTSSLSFDIHNNSITDKFKFLIKSDNDESTKNQTSTLYKLDCPTKLSF